MADYPTEFEVDAVLRDGHVVQIRPIRPEDQDGLVSLFDRTSSESRYFRFFRAKDKLTPKELEYFTTVDYRARMAFVVFDDGEVVAVARYDRLADDPSRAEVAFMVADAHQGRGIGTQLLQLLTAHARRVGVEGFEALVMSENAAMLRLFRTSGYALERRLGQGVYEVQFPTAESEDSMAAADRREQTAVTASMLPFFVPRAVAVIGASNSEGSIGGALFSNIVGSDYTGDCHPVHPTAKKVGGVRAYPSILDVPGPVDLAFVVVPEPAVFDVVSEAAEKGVRAVVVISAGFSEIGELGEEREARLLRLVRDNGMRMVGPNCMGLLNTDPALQLNGTFAPIFPPAGNVAMSSQSGALGIAILEHARRTGIGISTFVSVGNKADVSANDLLLYWEEDPTTDVIVLYVESFGNPRRFGRVARRISQSKPIVAVKSGRTDAGTRAASSHTGALASTDRAVDALFRQTGVIRTDSLEELFGVTSMLSNQPVPAGRRVGIVTNAGGPAILVADALDAKGLELVEFSDELRGRLAETLPQEASVANPVDMIAGAGASDFERCLQLIAESGEVDALIAIFVPVSDDLAVEVAGVLRDAAASGPVPILTVFMSERDPAELLGDDRARVPAFQFPEAAANSLAKVVEYGDFLRRPKGAIPEFEDIDAAAIRAVIDTSAPGWLSPDAVSDVLAAVGLRQPRSAVATSPEEAADIATDLGPVAMKVVSETITHKTDVGGIELDVEGSEDVAAAFDRIHSSADDATGVLVQEMVGAGLEVLVGVSNDPQFGHLIVFGMGGIFVELLDDVAFRIHPLTDHSAWAMLDEIRAAPMLSGYRTLPEADREAVVDVLLRVSALVELVPEIVELDVNPLLVHEPGDGATVVDARIKIAAHHGDDVADIPAVVGRRS